MMKDNLGFSKTPNLDKSIEEMDRQWNCLEGISSGFDEKRTKRVNKCLKK